MYQVQGLPSAICCELGVEGSELGVKVTTVKLPLCSELGVKVTTV